MAQTLNERLLEEIEEQHESGYPIASLIVLGREKGYVTLDDISTILPESERSITQLEEIFAALLSASITYIEDDKAQEPSDDELETEEEEKEPEIVLEQEDYLANVETKDTVGLYLKEAEEFRCSPHKKKLRLQSVWNWAYSPGTSDH